MELSFRKYQKSDYKNQRKLFELSFPETINTSIASDQHYEWKFHKFPSSPNSYEYVAEDTELVGYYAAIPYKYKIGSDLVTCGMVCDVMTHPDRRGKGIFTKLGHFATAQMKNEGLHFTSGYPIRPEVIPGHLKVGWKIVVNMPMYLRPIGITSILPSPIKFLGYLVNPIINFFQLWTEIKNKNYETKEYTKEEFLKLNNYEEFLNLWVSEQQNALIKDKAFIDWRTQAPNTEYNFTVLYHDSKIVGTAISRSTILKGISSLAIMDMMILKEHYIGAGTLHQALKRIARKKLNDVVVTMCPPKWSKNYRFSKYLYLKTPAVFSLIIKNLTPFKNEEMLFVPENWHLFWLDSDDL